ncbi:MAG: CBS domain-containing protein [Thermotogota bacterium]|nr:CBS domain-containing protein [Thermotogota bacterium]
MKVKDAMINDVSAIFEDESVEDFVVACLRKMRTGLPVVDEKYRVIGFISESDVIKSSLPSYFSLLRSASFIPDTHQFMSKLKEIRNDPASEHMFSPAITVKPEDTTLHAADLLIKKGLKTIPVVDDESRLLGYINRLYLIKVGLEGKINSE